MATNRSGLRVDDGEVSRSIRSYLRTAELWTTAEASSTRMTKGIQTRWRAVQFRLTFRLPQHAKLRIR